jgi:prephenate dehydrogenase
MFNKICIIGVGLIGGSIAIAAREKGLTQQVVGYGRKQSSGNLAKAKKLGVIDEYFFDIDAAVENSDCVIICTPVGAVEKIFRLLQPGWSASTVYTDAGSTKVSVVEAIRNVFGYVPGNFVPAHPVAGAEQSGVEAARSDLYCNKRLIITPVAETDSIALHKITEFWGMLGSEVTTMTIQHHDAVLAATSHLPHVLAFSLVDLLGEKDAQDEIFKYAAGGFKDFTRIASSDPTMWLDICLANKGEIVPLIRQLKAELEKIAKMLENSEEQTLFEVFSRAKNARQRFLDQLE